MKQRVKSEFKKRMESAFKEAFKDEGITIMPELGVVVAFGTAATSEWLEHKRIIDQGKRLLVDSFHESDYTLADWKAINKLKQLGFDIAIYDDPEVLDGVTFSGVAMTVFDLANGGKFTGHSEVANGGLAVFKECYPELYKNFAHYFE